MALKPNAEIIRRGFINSCKAVIGRGGSIQSGASISDLPQSIFNIPVDTSLAFYEDSSVEYIKTVPQNVNPYAMVKLIGGMTYKDDTAKTFTNAKATELNSKGLDGNIIDTFTIPVEAIEARVEGFGLGIDSTDYNYIECIDDKKQYVQVCKEIILTGEEVIREYIFKEMNGVSIPAILDVVYTRAKAICTDTEKTLSSGTTQNSMWVGVNNRTIYWVGILDILGLSTVEEFKVYLANRYANGNPVKIIYKLATPIVTDITDLITSDIFMQVEGLGTITAVNEYEYAVPTTIKYVQRIV